jgi:hypothetical protein
LNNKESNFDVLTILNRIKLIKCVVIHFWPRKKIKKIKNKKKSKIQEDIHEESLEDCPS